MDEIQQQEPLAEISQPVVEAPSNEPEYYGIPIEFFKTFKIPIDNISGMEVTQLRDIVDWAKKNSSDGNIYRTISTLQSRLGAPNANQRNFEKAWNFIKMSSIVGKLIGG